jgi:hypothetical protein
MRAVILCGFVGLAGPRGLRGAGTAAAVAVIAVSAPARGAAVPWHRVPRSRHHHVGDPTSFVDLTFTGQAPREMFDRRTGAFGTVNAYLFLARFGASKTVEIQVNPEFSQAQAEAEARTYATVVGRLPAFAFRDLDTMWIHAGRFPFGGGNRNLLIHTAQGEEYTAGGYLEEIFVHEGTHTSIDGDHGAAARWLEAQAADGTFVSTYARDNPTREDVAETMVPYLAQRFRADRLAPGTVDTIRAAIPNRLRYLDCLGVTMEPLR